MSIQINAQGKLDILKDRTEGRFHPTEDFTLEEIQSLLDKQREEIVGIIRGHTIHDWSGEAEVYEELEQIINKIKEM